MNKAIIAGYCRSPFTPASKGQLAIIRPDDLIAQVVMGLVDKTAVNVDDIEDLILGCAFPEGEQGLNLGRIVVHLAKLPHSVAGMTINRFCGSSMQAIHIAAGAIEMNAGELFICAGVESMTRIPMGGYNSLPNPGLYDRYPEAYISMGETAENLATEYQIPRQTQEQFAVESHAKATIAQQKGFFQDEIIPIVTTSQARRINQDGCIRADTTESILSELPLAFVKSGSVTAGTASPLTDGAAAVLVCSEQYADQNHLPKIARIISTAVSGCAPEIMGIGPVGATEKALQRARIELHDLGVVELNEAFAAQSLAVLEHLSIPENILNIDGGAIALGHPLGASGARITGKAASLLQRENKRYALATQCIGGGQGIATILEAI
ncbi:MAG TPA: thiolase family protein [Methylococcaceae bacterium]|jgi:acetyl-CoA acyltransferase|nr:thiolase family protein [Methylococcaceae bacterium]HIO12327.1 thiolase family protein [Methylococcales bacterium]HIO45276.1 thiolase family protein [Methylococcales bacterium]